MDPIRVDEELTLSENLIELKCSGCGTLHKISEEAGEPKHERFYKAPEPEPAEPEPAEPGKDGEAKPVHQDEGSEIRILGFTFRRGEKIAAADTPETA